jgi:Ca2+-binding RTX toxin-like protein
MPTPSSWSSSTTTLLTGVLQIDALLRNAKWTSGFISYSFPEYSSYWSTSVSTGYGPSSGNQEPWDSLFSPLNASQKAYFTSALKSWSNVANLTFYLVAESSTTVGDIRAAFTDTPDAQAWAYGPANAAYGGDVWFGADSTSARYLWTPGSYEYKTVIHEIGHALGLKHNFAAQASNAAVLPVAQDTRSFTIMSYSAKPGDNDTYFSYEPTTPMMLDIQAIQYLYGANYAYHSGADLYTFSDSTAYHETIWDGGGIDTLQYTGAWGSNIDIRGGQGSDIGVPVYVETSNGTRLYAVHNVWIAPGVTIENAIGGTWNDTITGNDASNSLQGGSGNDIIYGGLGDDTFDWDSTYRGGTDIFYGGAGNDIFVLDTVLDTVVEITGEGSDTIWVSFSYSLSSLPFVENLFAIGPTGLSLAGNSGDNQIGGTSGNDSIDGGAGSDTIVYKGLRTSYTVTTVGGAISISSASDGTDSVRNVEFVRFQDQTLSLSSIDATPPITIGFSPRDEAINVAVSSNIVVSFSETILRGAGSIVLKTGSGVTVETFNATTSTRLTIAGTTLTIDPTSDLTLGTEYRLEIAPGTIKDSAGNGYLGTTTYNFRTVEPANHAPTGTVSISGAAIKGQTLKASNTLADAEGMGTISYQWIAGNVNITGATTSSYLLTDSDVGKAISVVAKYVDGLGNAETKSSISTSVVTNAGVAAQVFGPSATVCLLNRAFNDTSPGNLIFSNQLASATKDSDAFVTSFGKAYDSLSHAALSAKVMGNMGLLPNSALQDALTVYFAANPSGRGQVVLQLGQILTTLVTPTTPDLAIYVPQASAWNVEITEAYRYSSDVNHLFPAATDDQLIGIQTIPTSMDLY